MNIIRFSRSQNKYMQNFHKTYKSIFGKNKIGGDVKEA